jgi:transposase
MGGPILALTSAQPMVEIPTRRFRQSARENFSLCGTRLTAEPHHILKVSLVSVREEVESYESFVIQERWPDSEGSPMWTNENRARYDRSHLRYPSDLTDDEWKLVEPLIPPGRRGGDKRTVIMREVVNGLMYILSTGCQWRAIPKDLPPRSTLYDYFDLWSWDRTLDLIHHELYVKCREAIGREASPTAAVIDSQSVKSAEKGGLRLIHRATTRERRLRARSGTFSSIRKAC